MSTDYDAVLASQHPTDLVIVADMCRGADLRKAFSDAGARYMPAAQPIQVGQSGPGQSNGAPADGADVWALRKAATHAALTKEAEARHAAQPALSVAQHYDRMLTEPSDAGRTLASWLR